MNLIRKFLEFRASTKDRPKLWVVSRRCIVGDPELIITEEQILDVEEIHGVNVEEYLKGCSNDDA